MHSLHWISESFDTWRCNKVESFVKIGTVGAFRQDLLKLSDKGVVGGGEVSVAQTGFNLYYPIG